MGFDRVWILLFLTVVPVLFFFFMKSWKLFSKFPNLSTFLHGSVCPYKGERLAIAIVRLLALTFVIIGLSNPFLYVASKEDVYHDVRLIFLIDVSRSMAYGEDITPSRLKAAKREIREVYDSLDGNYEAAIIPFAGEPNIFYCPLTFSKSTFFEMLKELDETYAPTLGTDLIRVFDSFKSHFVKNERIDKSGLNLIILLSDGGKSDNVALDRSKLLSIVKELSQKNFKVYAVGIGSNEPVSLILRDKNGAFIDYLRDGNGTLIKSELDEDILQKIAEHGNGKYVNFNADSKLSNFIKNIVLENRKSAGEVVEYDKLYVYPFCYALSAILIFLAALYNRRLLWKT